MYPLIFGSGFLSSLFTPIAFQKGGDLSQNHKVASANKILMAMTGIYIIGAVVLIGFFAVFHQSLVLLISNISFIRYSHLLPWLTLAWALFFLGQMFSTFGFLANQPRIYIMPKLVSSVVAVSATFYLSFRIGPIGVVWGLLLAGFIYALWCGIIVLRLVRRETEPLFS
jgi:O-antigen/teichoic acid export membrane protein